MTCCNCGSATKAEACACEGNSWVTNTSFGYSAERKTASAVQPCAERIVAARSYETRQTAKSATLWRMASNVLKVVSNSSRSRSGTAR